MTFGEPAKKRKRKKDAPSLRVYVHPCKMRDSRMSPHTFRRAYTRADARGSVCIGSKNWSKKERRTEREMGERGIGEWRDAGGEDKVAREKERERGMSKCALREKPGNERERERERMHVCR